MSRPRTILSNMTSYVEPTIGDGIERPRQWRYIVQQASLRRYGEKPRAVSVGDALRSRSPVFTWSPSTSLIGLSRVVPVNILFFGAPKLRGQRAADALRLLRYNVLTRLSARVFVNDPWTGREIADMTGVESQLLPMAVDTDFFSYRLWVDGRDTIVIAGNNGRDEPLAVELAKAGAPITRVTSSPAVRDFHMRNAHPRLTLAYDLSYIELRNLYQRARVVLVPLVDFNHAAGLTATYEAMACGAPVIMTPGRAREATLHLPTVWSASGPASAWLGAIDDVEAEMRSSPDLTAQTVRIIENVNHPDRITDTLIDCVQFH